jgi:type IV fimbrial biogenesis protein FimT
MKIQGSEAISMLPAEKNNVQRGFTLIEAMVAVAILAILMTLAVPSFTSMVAKSRLQSATSELMSSIVRTRMEALQFGRRVTMCRSADGANCIASAGNWDTGWITFIDPTRSGVLAEVDPGATVTAIVSALPSDVVILGNGNVEQNLSYRPDGVARGMSGSGALAVSRFRVCSTSSALTDADRGREIQINAAGRPTVNEISLDISCPAPT